MGGEEQVLEATEEACRVYVGNLLPKAKERHLTSKFARFGTIHSVWIARKPPGFAFVRFAARDAAQRAVEACGEDGVMEILGKAVRVQMAEDKDSKHQEQAGDRHAVKDEDADAVRTAPVEVKVEIGDESHK
uniref:RRM domain-containing protein n=1 Tax=Phytophthora ramorum TaxID=164328 RepID=H3HCL3_PHYRM